MAAMMNRNHEAHFPIIMTNTYENYKLKEERFVVYGAEAFAHSWMVSIATRLKHYQ